MNSQGHKDLRNLFRNIAHAKALQIYLAEEGIPDRARLVASIQERGGNCRVSPEDADWILVGPDNTPSKDRERLIRTFGGSGRHVVLSYGWIAFCISLGELHTLGSEFCGFRIFAPAAKVLAAASSGIVIDLTEDEPEVVIKKEEPESLKLKISRSRAAQPRAPSNPSPSPTRSSSLSSLSSLSSPAPSRPGPSAQPIPTANYPNLRRRRIPETRVSPEASNNMERPRRQRTGFSPRYTDEENRLLFDFLQGYREVDPRRPCTNKAIVKWMSVIPGSETRSAKAWLQHCTHSSFTVWSHKYIENMEQ